jgi:hypothetical protein
MARPARNWPRSRSRSRSRSLIEGAWETVKAMRHPSSESSSIPRKRPGDRG